MSDNLPQQGSLERLGIQVETPIDENILTEGSARNVRFRSVKVSGVSKPLGYSFGEVDKFVQDIVTPSLVWYQKTLHERDKTVYFLGSELDKVEAEKAELVNQVKTFEYNASVRTGLNAFQEDKEVATLLQRLKTVEAERDAALANAGGVVNVQEYLDAIEARDEYIAQITEQFTQLQQSYQPAVDTTELENAVADKEQELVTLRAELDSLRTELLVLQSIPSPVDNSAELQEKDEALAQYQAHVETITSQYNQLLEQYNQLQADVEAQGTDNEAKVTSLTAALAQANSDISRMVDEQKTLQEEVESANQRANEAKDDENVAILQAHIGTITEQYNQLIEQYQALESQVQNANENNADLQAKEAELEQYKAHVETITTQYNTLLEQYQVMSETASNTPVGASDEVVAQYQAHIAAITDQYNQLFEQYQVLEAQLQQQPVQTENANENNQELYAYIETIRSQYETLLAAYNELQQNASLSVNNAEIGELRVELEASKAEILRLQEILAEYEAEEESNENAKPLLPLPLSTDKKKEVPLPPQFTNLPEGIRPEDLV